MAKKKTVEDKAKIGQRLSADNMEVKPGEQKKRASNQIKKQESDQLSEETKAANEPKKPAAKTKKTPQVKPADTEYAQTTVMSGFLTVRLPKTLRTSLEKKMLEEEVSLDELVTYLLMRGLSAK